jgi:hypothetical protein
LFVCFCLFFVFCFVFSFLFLLLLAYTSYHLCIILLLECLAVIYV